MPIIAENMKTDGDTNNNGPTVNVMLNVPTSTPTVALSLYSHIYTQIDASEYSHRTTCPFMNRSNVMM